MLGPVDEVLQIARRIGESKKLDLAAVEQNVGSMHGLRSIEDLILQCGKTARSHGFWNAHVGKALKLIGVGQDAYDQYKLYRDNLHVTNEDASELLREARKLVFTMSQETICELEVISGLEQSLLLGDPFVFLGLVGTEIAEAMEACRGERWEGPDSVVEELADAVIRIFDFVKRYERKGDTSKFESVLIAKMAVNEARPHLHGKGF